MGSQVYRSREGADGGLGEWWETRWSRREGIIVATTKLPEVTHVVDAITSLKCLI